jgi:hypothetical protein
VLIAKKKEKKKKDEQPTYYPAPRYAALIKTKEEPS